VENYGLAGIIFEKTAMLDEFNLKYKKKFNTSLKSIDASAFLKF
jgi:hypothetical protein